MGVEHHVSQALVMVNISFEPCPRLSFRKKEEIEEYFAKPGEEFDYPSADTLRGLCFQRTTFDELQLSETFLRMIHSNRRVPLFARSDGKLWTSLGSYMGKWNDRQ
jgi:hypothetical protein